MNAARWMLPGRAPGVWKVAAAALLVSSGALGALLLDGDVARRLPGIEGQPVHVAVADDADADGLPDAIENRIGSDPLDPQTIPGITDGWLRHWFKTVPWDDPGFASVPALAAPAAELPSKVLAAGSAAPIPLDQFFAGEQQRRSAKATGAWWLVVPALDPTDWDNNEDGVADAWLLRHGLDPLKIDGDDPAPGEATLSLRQKYQDNLDPAVDDTDGDGLRDGEELAGRANLGGAVQFPASDPGKPSTAGDGVNDGFAVALGLDPRRPNAAHNFTVRGLSVLEAQQATLDHCRATAKECRWRDILSKGPLVDPRKVDNNADGVPDAWAHRDPHGVARPLVDARTQTIASSNAWDATAWTLGREPSIVIDDANPRPDARVVTVRDAYAYGRPSTWNETTMGPWTGGLATRPAQPPGALPVPVGIRGWNILIDRTLGREQASMDDAITLKTQADPRLGDTDRDGLTDLEEYLGREGTRVVPRTSASSPDSDGDGLDDAVEVRVHGTDPTRLDSAGSFLEDGRALAYWLQRHATAVAAFEDDAEEARSMYGWLAQGPSLDIGALTPTGDLDADGKGNLLDGDADGDGLHNGAELQPNRFLLPNSRQPRPQTDPARTDSDGDALPDTWEIAWSPDIVYRCNEPCDAPGGGSLRDDWPLHPNRTLSWHGLPTSILTDAQVNLAQDRIVGAVNREFSNGLAYKYGLSPYDRDPDDDLIPSTFELHWGIEAVPAWASSVAQGTHELAWSKTAFADIAQRLVESGHAGDLAKLSGVAFMDPARKEAVTPQSNLLGMLEGRDKGTWVYTDECLAGASRTLPSTGSQRETHHGRSDAIGARSLPSVVATRCWVWREHVLANDIAHGTNPWRHDSTGQGLPDAWRLHYGIDLTAAPHTLAPGGLAADCDNVALHAGLPPREGYCPTLMETYMRGLDPNVGDTDEGSLADWVELALDLDPLDPFNDRGDEDWDADGLVNVVEGALGLNPLDADTDNDGLLDGDRTGERYKIQGNRPDEQLAFLRPDAGNGNLCLPDPGAPGFVDAPAGNMANRPVAFGGPLTVAQVVSLYRQQGVVYDDTPQTCPAGQLLFLRESIFHAGRQVMLPPGRSSSSTLASTSGDGIPDGWKAFWGRDGSTPDEDAGLDTARDTRSIPPSQPAWDPDRDGEPTYAEFGLGPAGERLPGGPPVDWLAPRDGVWWGGSDPTERDTDGDAAWHAVAAEGQDGQDKDLDNDGVPDRYDANPADHNDAGIVRWSREEQRYVVDWAAWRNATLARDRTSLLDVDGDSVPDFLDRARVAVHDVRLETPSGTLQRGTLATITGRVAVDEPGVEAPVGGATVVAWIEGVGARAPIAAATTASDGQFTLTTALQAESSMVVPPGTTVQGRRAEESLVVLPGTSASVVPPGPINLRVEVEANGRSQIVSFGGQPNVPASKTAPFVIPDGAGGEQPRLAAVRLVGGEPDRTDTIVTHAADGIFPGSSEPIAANLRGTAAFEVRSLAPVRAGDSATVTGALVRDGGAPIPDVDVEVHLEQAGHPVVSRHVRTDEDGAFEASLPSDAALAGDAQVVLRAELSNPLVADPPVATVALTLLQESSWVAVSPTCSGLPCQAGGEVPINARNEVAFLARLVDHQGRPVAGAPVKLTVAPLGGSAMHEANLVSGDQGLVTATIPRFDGRPAVTYEARLRHNGGPHVTSVDHTLFFQPSFGTRIEGVQAPPAPLGTATVTGRLLREDGTPIQGAGNVVTIHCEDGTTGRAVGTGANGSFSATLMGMRARRLACVAGFPGALEGQLLPSQPARLTATWFAGTSIVGTATATEGSPVEVRGTLAAEDHVPPVGARVEIRSREAGTVATVAEDGSFQARLPPLVGTKELNVTFDGNATLRPTRTSLAAQVRTITILGLAPVHVEVSPPDGQAGRKQVFAGSLLDPQGNGLGGRTVDLRLRRSAGEPVWAGQATTDAAGRFSAAAPAGLLDEPGPWRSEATYAGSTADLPSNGTSIVHVRHNYALADVRAPGILPGAPWSLTGTLAAAGFPRLTANLTVYLDEVAIANGTIQPGMAWSLPIPRLQVSPGAHRLRLTADAGPGTNVTPLELDARSTTNVSIQIVQRELPNGTVLDLRATAPGFDGAIDAVLLVDGRPLIVALGPQGNASVALPGGSHEVRFLAVRQRDLVATASHEVDALDYRVLERPPSTLPYLLLAVSAATIAISMVATIILLRLRLRAELRPAVERGLDLVLSKGDARRAVQLAFLAALDCLRASGRPVAPELTARQVTAGVSSLLGIPRAPLDQLAELYDRARFSGAGVRPVDRDEATATLQSLASALRVPLRTRWTA